MFAAPPESPRHGIAKAEERGPEEEAQQGSSPQRGGPGAGGHGAECVHDEDSENLYQGHVSLSDLLGKI